MHCLEKAPESRFQNARDLVFALENLTDAPARPTGAMPAFITASETRRRRSRHRHPRHRRRRRALVDGEPRHPAEGAETGDGRSGGPALGLWRSCRSRT